MAGGMGAGAYEGILGGTLGGIGDIVSSASYSRPKLKPATGMELRLRQLAQDQLLGGGQQLLGATALYNQMAPALMSMLPGMHYVPGGSGNGGSGGGAGGPSGGGAAGGGSSNGPGGDYAQALQGYQGGQQLQNQLNQLKAQIKGAKPGQGRQQLIKQRNQLQQQIKGTQPVNQLERQAYMAGSQPGSYDIQMGPPAPMPSQQSSLGDINGLLAQLAQSRGQPNLASGQSGLGEPGQSLQDILANAQGIRGLQPSIYSLTDPNTGLGHDPATGY